MGTFTDEEILERRKGVGSSEVAALFGEGYAGQTELSLYLEKTGQLSSTLESSEAMEWGLALEEPIAQMVAQRTGLKIRRQPVMRWMKNPAENPLFSSIDRQIVAHPRGPGVMEIKNYNEFLGRTIESLEDVPLKVRVQAMHQLAVTGYDWGVVAILVGGNRLVHFEFERDQDAIDAIVQRCREFMHRVYTQTPPSVDARSEDILKEVYSKGGQPALVCHDPQLRRIAEDMTEWKARTKAAEEEWAVRKNVFRLYMGDAEAVEIPGYGEIQWKKTKDKPVRVFREDLFKAENPELYEKYVERVVKPGHRNFVDRPEKER